MFDVGFSELMLVALIALLVFGPERLPRLVREAGFWIRKIRGVVTSARSEIERELQLAELRDSLQQQRKTVEKELNLLEIKQPTQRLPSPPELDEPSNT